MDLALFLSNLESRHFFYLAIASWFSFVLGRRISRRWLTSGILMIAIAFTVLWFDRLPKDEVTRIIDTGIELLKIVVSWPLVISFIFLAFRAQISDLIRKIGQRISESTTAEFEVGDIFKAKLESPKLLGKVAGSSGESAKHEIVKMVETEAPQLPVKLPPGIVEIFTGKEAVFGEVSVSAASGFVADKNGYVVTYDPGLRDAPDIFVRLFEESRILPARVVKRIPETFLALLELPQGTYPQLKLSQAAYPDIGEQVFKVSIRSGVAVGSVTTIHGVVRVQDRMVEGVITVEPALSMGGDGGSPVLNKQGEVIGVLFAGGNAPPQSLLISASRILEVLPIV